MWYMGTCVCRCVCLTVHREVEDAPGAPLFHCVPYSLELHIGAGN